MSSNGRSLRTLFDEYRLADFPVTWAGPGPGSEGYCFGSEEGAIRFTDSAFRTLAQLERASYCREAINGVAYAGDWLAVSTRADICMRRLSNDNQNAAGIPIGAHGIVATQSGYFVAPMGRKGILILKAGSRPGGDVGLLTPPAGGTYFYRIAVDRARAGKDLVLCAVRRGGFGVVEFLWGDPTYKLRVAASPSMDVIDVCSIASNENSAAAAAIALDGTLLLLHDLYRDPSPRSIKFRAIQGTAYRVLASGDDLVVLTSRGLYLLEKLAGRVKAGLPASSFTTQIMVLPLEAADVAIVRDHTLLAILPDTLLAGDLGVLRQSRGPDPVADQIEETPEVRADAWSVNDLSGVAGELASV